ncbi:hypothetical protein ABH917_003736 [Thermobifida halotolerans]
MGVVPGRPLRVGGTCVYGLGAAGTWREWDGDGSPTRDETYPGAL